MKKVHDMESKVIVQLVVGRQESFDLQDILKLGNREKYEWEITGVTKCSAAPTVPDQHPVREKCAVSCKELRPTGTEGQVQAVTKPQDNANLSTSGWSRLSPEVRRHIFRYLFGASRCDHAQTRDCYRDMTSRTIQRRDWFSTNRFLVARKPQDVEDGVRCIQILLPADVVCLFTSKQFYEEGLQVFAEVSVLDLNCHEPAKLLRDISSVTRGAQIVQDIVQSVLSKAPYMWIHSSSPEVTDNIRLTQMMFYATDLRKVHVCKSNALYWIQRANNIRSLDTERSRWARLVNVSRSEIESCVSQKEWPAELQSSFQRCDHLKIASQGVVSIARQLRKREQVHTEVTYYFRVICSLRENANHTNNTNTHYPLLPAITGRFFSSIQHMNMQQNMVFPSAIYRRDQPVSLPEITIVSHTIPEAYRN